MTIAQAAELALQHHRAGRLAEAETLCRQILAVHPNHADALHILGILVHQAGRQGAADLIRRAIAVNPTSLDYHINLGNVLSAQGRPDEAIAAYRRVLQINPSCVNAYYNLGIALQNQGQVDEAIANYRAALQLEPDFAMAHNNLGAALKAKGQLDEAVASYRRALEVKPDYVEAYKNLSVALRGKGQVANAIDACRCALQIDPHYADAWYHLGIALNDQGNLDGAIEAYRRALQIMPEHAEALNNLGGVLMDQGELDEAIAAFRGVLRTKHQDPGFHSNLIYALHLHPDHDSRMIFEEHQRWNRQFGDPQKQFVRPHANNRSPERQLRVGYVSPDFWDHAVGRYALPLLERHDRQQFEILCYSAVVRPDWMTERFRALAGNWRNTVGVSDAHLAEMIRDDGVDILVDLTLHTGGNRLPMFARQPAPVQVAWLGYPGSTGLPGIGYRLTDARVEPPGEETGWSAEERVRLPDCWCCYHPAGEFPEINALPAASAQGVTFGSLNNFAKMHEAVLALWARTLEAVKGSRLVMQCPEGRARERARASFGARGIGMERVELVGILSRWEYLSLYHRIDLGLDPFPYNGTTTTCDALWMGVPVLTLPGKMPASRAGLSLLSNVGLGELVTYSEEDYLRMAVALTGNLPRLANLRATLRARMLASPLMDAPRFARNVEASYRSMWRAWCAGQSPICG